MFVIEVRPKRAWRGLKFQRDAVARATVTTRHQATSHWFQHQTADWLVGRTVVRSAGRVLDLPPDRWRIQVCTCDPLALR